MVKNKVFKILSKIRGNSWNKQYFELQAVDTKDALLNFQHNHLTKLLSHSYHSVPYYGRIFEEIGLVNNGIVDISKFNDIPILSKEIIREFHEELISNEYTKRKWYYNSSGGSTGEPIKLIQDDLFSKWSYATNHYYYNDIIGIDLQKSKKILLWGSEKDIFEGGIGLKSKIINWLTDTVLLNSFRMTEEDMDDYIKIINSYKPDFIRGYAGSLYELCRYAEKKQMIIYKPKILVSAAETLRNEMRDKIEAVFETKLYDFYGSREVSNLAGKCTEGAMHVFMFWNYVEILDNNNQPVKEGEEGKVVVTNLHNYSMPLIRYEIGDMAVLGTEKCKCGNVLPTLNKVTGRITDHFIKKDGTIIHGEYFTHLFYLKDWVKAFQVIQEDYNIIKLLVVSEDNIAEPKKKDIDDKIKTVMGQDCKIIWNFVDEIPKTKSGKYLYTKSMVWR